MHGSFRRPDITIAKQNARPTVGLRRTSPENARGNGIHQEEFISFIDITRFVRVNFFVILLFVAIGLLAATFYISTTPKTFTARTQILIDPRIPELLLQRSTEVNLSLDTAQVESQIAVMRSEKIATMVINELKLQSEPEFSKPANSSMVERLQRLVTTLGELFGLQDNERMRLWVDELGRKISQDSASPAGDGPQALTEFQRERRTISIFNSNLDVRRVGVSYAIDISFSSQSPVTAANVANALASAFIREQLDSKASAAREGSGWLERRLAELRTQMNKATQVAQQFRAKHDYSVSPERDSSQATSATAETEESPSLEELEVAAETYRKMYESFLQAFTNSVSQQSYPVADARIITSASPPLGPSSPRTTLILVLGGLGGAMAGIAYAFLRHLADRTFRSPQQIRDELGIDCLGELPALPKQRWKPGYHELERSPRSLFSEALRRVRTAVSLAEGGRPIRCIGFASALPRESRSACISSLATLYEMSGLRTLVIDADVYQSTLTQNLVRRKDRRFVEVAEDTDPIAHRIISFGSGCFDFLPSTATEANLLLVPERMQLLLCRLQSYDIVLVDLPSLSSGTEELAIASLLDAVIVVVQWGKTPNDLVAELLHCLRVNRAPVIGALMTDVGIMSTLIHPRLAARRRTRLHVRRAHS